MKQYMTEAAAATPPIGVAGMTWFGYSVDDWLKAVSVLWLVIQIGYFAYKLWRDRNKKD